MAWASRARLFGCGPHPAWVALRPLPASCLPGHTTPHRGPLWPSRLSECRQSERERVASWLSAQSCTSAGEREGVLGLGNPTEVWQTSDHVGYYSDLRRCAAQQQILQLWSLSRPVPKPRPVPSGVCEEGECSLWLVSRLSLQSLPSRREDCTVPKACHVLVELPHATRARALLSLPQTRSLVCRGPQLAALCCWGVR